MAEIYVLTVERINTDNGDVVRTEVKMSFDFLDIQSLVAVTVGNYKNRMSTTPPPAVNTKPDVYNAGEWNGK